MKKVKQAAPVSNLDVLRAISDQISFDIITTISNHTTNPDNLMRILDITPKQYYSRSSRLLKMGIISRNNGEIILTSFGHLVYNAQMKIAAAFSHASELRIIDAIKSHSGMSEEEQKRIIDKLLEDTELKKLIV
jgi:predicted transcriptional regulator